MTLIETTPPALEPVSLAEAKAHLRLDTSADDLLVSTLISAARQALESSLQMALISRSYSLFIDAWPAAATPLLLPIAPIVQLTTMRTFAHDDTPATHALTGFELDRGPPARIVSRVGVTLPSSLRRLNAIEIAFTAGFGPDASDVPQPLRQALLHLLADLYERRGLAADDAQISAVEPLLAPWRRHRLV